MPDDSENGVPTDTSAVNLSDKASDFQASYSQDSSTQSGVSSTTLGLLKDYVSAYLQQQNIQLPPESADYSDLIDDIKSELGLEQSDPLDPLIQSLLDDIAAGKGVASTSSPKANVSKAGDPIEMFSGAFLQEATDLAIPGAGMNFAFRRIYKNQAVCFGSLGANWDHCYNLHIRQWGASLIRSSGELRDDLYTKHPLFGQAGFNYWVPPDGRHGIIEESGNSYTWRSPSGVRFAYQPDPSDATFHRINRIEDRFGNYLAFTYTDEDLTRVEINHPARLVTLAYDTLDRIIGMRDYAGRQWTYDYDDSGDLVTVTSPATGRYPAGLATNYEYSSIDFSPPLQHNLLRIIDPAGQFYLENDYGLDQGLLSFNRVVRQRQGDGEYYYEYETVVDDFEFDYNDSEKPAIQVNQMLRNGQMVHFIFNRFGNMLLREEYLLQGGFEDLVQWRYRYNRDGALVGTITPEGCVTQCYYGRDDYLSVYGITDEEVATDSNLTSALRMGFGNLLTVVRRAKRYDFALMDLSLGVWGDFFPDVLAAIDVNDIIVKNTYESDYQQILSTSDPRFTASADPRGPEGPAYSPHLTTYEYSPLPLKTLSRIRYPDTTYPSALPDGTTGLANITEEYLDYDPRGRLRHAQDPEGNILENQYFAAGPAAVKEGYLLASIRDAGNLALTTIYDYNDVGISTSVTNPRGFQTTFVVNELNQTEERISAGPGFRTWSFYDENGLLQRQERDNLDDAGQPLPDGNEVKTYQYDEQNNLLKETMGGADLTRHHAVRHRYDGADCRIETIFPLGNRVRFDYEERTLLKSTTRGALSDLASTTKVLYDGDGRTIARIDGRGNYTRYAYDTFNRVTTTTDALGGVQQNAYDKLGNVAVSRFFEREADGNYYLLKRSESAYDERGNQVSRTDFLFPAPILTADVVRWPDLEFQTAQNQNNVTAVITQLFCDRNRRLFRQLNPLGQETTWQYDGASRKTLEQDNLGNYVQTSYDENSNVVRVDRHELVRAPGGGAVLGEDVFSSIGVYDPLDRRTTATDGLGNQTVFTYDSRDNPASITDPLGNVRRYQYDIFNRKAFDIAEMTVTGLGGSARLPDIRTQYVFDDNDRLTSVVDANGNVTQFKFDDLNRQFQTIYADGSIAQVTYDPDDNVGLQKDNNGLQMVYDIDPLGRRKRMDIDATSLSAQFPYPAGAETYEQYTYDGLGRPLQRTNDFYGITSQFDSLGRAYSETVQFTTPYPAPPGALALVRKFDALSNRTDITYPSGRSIHYDYDGLNRVRRIANMARGAGYPGSGALPIQYDVAAYEFRGLRAGKTTYGNQTLSEFSYDGAARLISTRHEAAGNLFLEIQQLFDGAGNRRFQLDNPPAPPRKNRETYSFDSLYRLTRFVRRQHTPIDPAQFAPPNAPLPANALNGQQAIDNAIGSLAQSAQNYTYRYDALGNRERERLPGQPQVAYAANGLNQFSAVRGTQFQYDLNGNLVDDGSLLYFYNYRNQLARVLRKATRAEVLRLLYDSAGRLIMIRGAGQTTSLITDGLNVVEEYDVGAVTAQYVYESGIDRRCQIASGRQEWWYHRDLLSSVRALTDSSGQPLAARYEYEPYGRLVGGPNQPNPYAFAGKRLLTIGVNTLYDSRARQYSPTLGRYLQRDPKGFVDGPNLYSYGSDNPVTYIDPLGTEKEKSAGGDTEEQETLEHVGHRVHQLHAAADAAEVGAASSELAEAIESLETATSALNKLAEQEIHINKFLAAQNAVRFGRLHEYVEAVTHAKNVGVLLGDSGALRKVVFAIGTLSQGAQGLLSGFAAGRLLLRAGALLNNPVVTKGLVVLNVGIEAGRGYLETPADGTGFKLENAALAGAGGFLVMANPYVAIADAAAPKGYKLSEIYRGTAAAVTAITEGASNWGDTKSLEKFQSRSRAGEYGQVMKAASEAGDF